jgi:hypothetical protein
MVGKLISIIFDGNELERLVCGRRSTSYQRIFHWQAVGRIVGGRQATPHSHPWQVLLNDRGKFCGGKKMISSKYYS